MLCVGLGRQWNGVGCEAEETKRTHGAARRSPGTPRANERLGVEVSRVRRSTVHGESWTGASWTTEDGGTEHIHQLDQDKIMMENGGASEAGTGFLPSLTSLTDPGKGSDYLPS